MCAVCRLASGSSMSVTVAGRTCPGRWEPSQLPRLCVEVVAEDVGGCVEGHLVHLDRGSLVGVGGANDRNHGSAWIEGEDRCLVIGWHAGSEVFSEVAWGESELRQARVHATGTR